MCLHDETKWAGATFSTVACHLPATQGQCDDTITELLKPHGVCWSPSKGSGATDSLPAPHKVLVIYLGFRSQVVKLRVSLGVMSKIPEEEEEVLSCVV